MTKFFAAFVFPVVACAAGADLAPSLQWVKTAGGSGVNTVSAAAGDGRGNLYITGYTTSLDFPT
ncbi:MAG TPA: hypothetical protein VHW24_07245, partial [Bryobacteraceae bacterium]|nr:hypothetical protein [Bryobacteraceae bacterium]